jgi:hypothetical protein
MTRLNLYVPPIHPAAVEAADCADLLRAELADVRRERAEALRLANAWEHTAHNLSEINRLYREDELANRELARQVIIDLAHLLPSPERAAILAHLSGPDMPPHKTVCEVVAEAIGNIALFLEQDDKDRILEILYPEGRE